MKSESADPMVTIASEVEMQIKGLMLDPITEMPIVILKAVSSDRVLPIWVGIFEANAIALELEKTVTPRPMTHDLLQHLGRALNARVSKIVVSALRSDTFYAVIWMEQMGEVVTLDARPSDAIALALRWDCPIYVNESVLHSAQTSTSNASTTIDPQEMQRWLENLNDDDFGRYKM